MIGGKSAVVMIGKVRAARDPSLRLKSGSAQDDNVNIL
jgi:hypothetical protein